MPGEEILLGAWAKWLSENPNSILLVTVCAGLGYVCWRLFAKNQKLWESRLDQERAHKSELLQLTRDQAEAMARHAEKTVSAMDHVGATLQRVATVQELSLKRKND